MPTQCNTITLANDSGVMTYGDDKHFLVPNFGIHGRTTAAQRCPAFTNP